MRMLAASLAVLLSLTVPAGAAPLAQTPPQADDPLESFNRRMFSFNRMVARDVIAPTVETVGPRLPGPVKTGLSNAYSNLTEIEFVLNNLLSGAPGQAAVSVGRFAVNSTAGVLGLFDVASRIGLERRELDFVESLCQTGIPPGPYVVLPLVGSANLYSAATLVTAVAVEVYALSFISTTLAAADLIIIDIGGSASALRYMNDIPADSADPYQAQRDAHLVSVGRGCGPAAPPPTAPAPSMAGTLASHRPDDGPPLRIRRADSIARPVGVVPVSAVLKGESR